MKTGTPDAKRALPPETHVSVDFGSTCAMSSRQASRLASAVRATAGGSARTVRSEHGDADRAGVEPFRMRADDGLVDAAVAALEDLPVLVDEKVVADVVPAVALHVVDLDPAHDRGRLRGGVRVAAGRVVDERKLNGA